MFVPGCTTKAGNAPRFRTLHQALSKNAPRKQEMHQAFSEMHQGKRKNATDFSHSIKIVVLSQKRVTLDFLTKRQKVNEGEAPQYYVEESHEPIIPPEEWEIVQLEMARRKALGRKYSGNSIFSARLVCADCGEFFGSKVWNSTDKYRRTIWQCNGKYKGENRCGTPHLDEEYIKGAFVTAFNSIIRNKDELIRNCRFVMDHFTDCSDIDTQLERLGTAHGMPFEVGQIDHEVIVLQV